MKEINQKIAAGGDADGSASHLAGGLPADQDPAFRRQVRDLRAMTDVINSWIDMPQDGCAPDGLPDPVDAQLREHEEMAAVEPSVVWVADQWEREDEVTETRACVLKTNGRFQSAVMRSVDGGEPSFTAWGLEYRSLSEAIHGRSPNLGAGAGQPAADASDMDKQSKRFADSLSRVQSAFESVNSLLGESGGLDSQAQLYAVSVLRLWIARAGEDSRLTRAAETTLQELTPALEGFELVTYDGWIGAAKRLPEGKPSGAALVDSEHQGYLVTAHGALYGIPFQAQEGRAVLCDAGVPVEAYEADRSIWSAEQGAWEGHNPATNRDVLHMPSFAQLNFVETTGLGRASLAKQDGIVVAFESYCSDGPGYCGPVTFQIAKDTIVVTTHEAVVLVLPESLPTVTSVRAFHPEDASFVKSCLEAQAREYLQDTEGVLQLVPERVKILEFSGGEFGFVVLHGEACCFDLVCGAMRFTVSGQDVAQY